jgi:hypothetical protein
MKFSVDRHHFPPPKPLLLSGRYWMVNALGDLKEMKGGISQTVYGGWCNFVGNLSHMTE